MAKFSIEDARSRRRAKAYALAALGLGQITPTEALSGAQEVLGGVDVYEVLMNCPGLGRESVRTVCERAAVWPHLRVAELTELQREAIVGALPARVRCA